jgi:acyl-CoA dehydrogenase
MNDSPAVDGELELLISTTRRMLSDESDDIELTRRFSAAGLLTLALPDPHGAGWTSAAAAVARACAGTRAAGWYGDSALVAGPLLHTAGLDAADGRLTAAVAEGVVERDGGRLRVRASAAGVAWANDANHLVVIAADSGGADIVFCVDRDSLDVTSGENIAGEPRDDVRISEDLGAGMWAPAPDGFREELMLRGGLARATAIAGAAATALSLSVRYVSERRQFGRPIGAFQSVQHHLAEIAVEVEAMDAVTAAAANMLDQAALTHPATQLAVAVAKAQTSASAGTVARIAHQLHGAIGTTQEHPLHHYTTRMWAWREEYGSERLWQRRLGEAALHTDVWELVT